ncbi:neuroendocrine convertase 2-like [Mya arenaria]|uniref:neuroendocrine convertase 2-like n=1 Tax=Mya arenaria TaxID=6604 RepID=UPI0022E75B2B|nr:neuroendocrine convertase 2-like [Mya arenaria]
MNVLEISHVGFNRDHTDLIFVVIKHLDTKQTNMIVIRIAVFFLLNVQGLCYGYYSTNGGNDSLRDVTNRFFVHLRPDDLGLVQDELKTHSLIYHSKVVDNLHIFENESSTIFRATNLELEILKYNIKGKIKQIEQCRRLLVGNDKRHTIATKHLTRKSSALYFRMVQYSAKQHSVDEAHSLLVCPPYWDQQERVDEVWRSSVTGHNILIAVTDIGMDVHHPELYPNIEMSLRWNIVNNNTDVSPDHFPNYYESFGTTNHGNDCGSVIAGVRGNNLCSAGVAPEAKIVPLKLGKVVKFMWDRPVVFDDSLSKALAYRHDRIDIYSNSWDFSSSFKPLDIGSASAIKEGIKRGRNGQGSIYVFPAGRRGNGFANSIYTIAVNNIGVRGKVPKTAYANSATLVSSFGQGRTRSSENMITAFNEKGRKCWNKFGGSSATTAKVAGICALILDAGKKHDKDLSWRDVQHILVKSATHEGLTEAKHFKRNGAGLYFHDVFGFGYVDVQKAVKLVSEWSKAKEMLKHRVVLKRISVDRQKEVFVGYSTKNNSVKITQVEYVTVDIPTYTLEEKTFVRLTSSSGTSINLAYETEPISAETEREHIKFATPMFWNENDAGKWTLELTGKTDKGGNEYKQLHLTVFGTGEKTHDHTEMHETKRDELDNVSTNKAVSDTDETPSKTELIIAFLTRVAYTSAPLIIIIFVCVKLNVQEYLCKFLSIVIAGVIAAILMYIFGILVS